MEEKKVKLLIIDTSAINCSVVISENDTVIISLSLNIKRLHDKFLAEFVQRALNDLNLKISDMDAVAFSSGPGSFTGLRIGASFVKGITIDNSPKLISLPTLQLFAVQSEQIAKSRKSESIISIIPANSGMIYTQEFTLESIPKSEPSFIDKQELILKHNITYTGLQINIFPDLSDSYNFSGITPEVLAKAAYRAFSSNHFVNSSDFEPQYIQEFIFKGN